MVVWFDFAGVFQRDDPKGRKIALKKRGFVICVFGSSLFRLCLLRGRIRFRLAFSFRLCWWRIRISIGRLLGCLQGAYKS
jgi:hypothetical protein